MLESYSWRPLCTNYSGELTSEVMRNSEARKHHSMVARLGLFICVDARDTSAQRVDECRFRLRRDLVERHAVSKLDELHRL